MTMLTSPSRALRHYTDVGILAEAVLDARASTPNGQATLIGISGIDASGKGYVAARLAREISSRTVALINADGWLNLPHVRFDRAQPARNFYQNALRLDEMFDRLVLPLTQHRSCRITADHVEETATEFRPRLYAFDDIDVVLLEGIFIFKRQFTRFFNLKIWIDCPFETALDRAIRRGQEGLERKRTIQAYETIYFPAQRLHFGADKPRECSDIIFDNS